jgi:type I restriction enzyme M protein
MHPDTFQPGNSTQTSVLVLERKKFDEIELERARGEKNEYDVFMALGNHIGHDKRGNKAYVRDEEGNEVVAEIEEPVTEVREGTPVYRTAKTKTKVVDDNTEQIAEAFRSWMDGRR